MPIKKVVWLGDRSKISSAYTDSVILTAPIRSTDLHQFIYSGRRKLETKTLHNKEQKTMDCYTIHKKHWSTN